MLSSTPKGVCKVAFNDGADTCLLSASSLVWLEAKPHPALAGLCFLAWTLAYTRQDEQSVRRFRARMLTGKNLCAGSCTLTVLAASADDPALLARLTLGAWRRVVKTRETQNLGLLADAWAAWRHGILDSRHSRAVRDLESTSAELHNARIAVLQQAQRFQHLGAMLEKIDVMHRNLWGSWALSAWNWVCQLARTRSGARKDRIQVALQ
eukprot:CAMPEP_0179193862 /NCGR_PEP_ID=MMETSP0796-20121207/96344_1 /TAXON_ID=73915 /ORGANISM="Pyrodinium bahamense, Strain pbaha01" /LENGTH=208 /DNA_ID=CAMNT_0020898177 /DNA_START=1 /DNA_END=624 /DNA_ORIENTATION=-